MKGKPQVVPTTHQQQQDFTSLLYKTKMATSQPESRDQEPELRIMLVGITGSGKTSTMNALLGIKPELTQLSASSTTTKCETRSHTFEEQKLVVVDTPGLKIIPIKREEVETALREAAAACQPHLFLLVLGPNVLSNDDKKALESFLKIFGKESKRYTMVLFTNRYANTSHKEGEADRFIKSLADEQHYFDNSGEKHPDQVRKLLKKINKMVKNNGKPYAKEMLNNAQEVKKVKEVKEGSKDSLMAITNLVVPKPFTDLIFRGFDGLIENIADYL